MASSHSSVPSGGSNGDDRRKKRKGDDKHLEGESKMTKRQPIGDVPNVAGNLMIPRVMGKSNAAVESHNWTSRDELMEDQNMVQLAHQEPLSMDDTYGLAENMLEFSLEKGKSKEKRRKQCDEILKRLSALSNSGGGVLKVGNSYGLSPDQWLMAVEERLHSLLEPESWANIGDTTCRPASTYIFVRKMATMFTISTECYEFSDTQLTRLSSGKVRKLLAEQAVSRSEDHFIKKGLGRLPPLPKMIYGKRPGNLWNETIREQFKNTSCDSFLTDLAKNVSGFANTRGGHLFWGIEEQKKGYMKIPIVKGRCCDDLDNIDSKIKEKIAKMKWGFEPEKGKHWNVQHIPVQGVTQCNKSTCNGDHYVVVVSVAKIRGSGGVYRRIPQSYGLSDNQPVKMDFDLWKKAMYAGTEYRKSNAYDELITQRMELLSISPSAGKSTSVYSVKDSVEEIADSLFQAKAFNDESTVWPESFYRNCLTDRQRHKVNEVLEWLALNEYQGTAICVKSVLDVAIKNQTTGAGIYEPETLICDLLLCVKDLGLFLLTVSDVNDDVIKQYNVETGKQLKQALAMIGGCTEKMAINCSILKVSSPYQPAVLLKRNNLYPDEYHELAHNKYLSVIRSLIIVLAAIPPMFSSKVGCVFLNTLTLPQFDILWFKFHEQRLMWVKGPPGTGKTVLAFELMRKLQREKRLNAYEILYVTEYVGNHPIARKTGTCTPVLRSTFVRRINRYEWVKHIILDGVQNFRDEDVNEEKWYDKALRMHKETKGYLWIFFDPTQKMTNLSNGQSGLPFEEMMIPMSMLTGVIRNSCEIYYFAEQYMHLEDDYEGKTIQPIHDFQGTEPEEFLYREENLVEDVCRVIRRLKESYSPSEIAVLTRNRTDGTIDKLEQGFKQKGVRFVKVNEEYDERCLTLDSIRRFSELERPVVIGIDPSDNPPLINNNAVMATLCTRAMAKLIIFHRSIGSSIYNWNQCVKFI